MISGFSDLLLIAVIGQLLALLSNEWLYCPMNGLINIRKYMGTSFKHIFAYMDFKKMSNLEKTGTDK